MCHPVSAGLDFIAPFQYYDLSVAPVIDVEEDVLIEEDSNTGDSDQRDGTNEVNEPGAAGDGQVSYLICFVTTTFS